MTLGTSLLRDIENVSLSVEFCCQLARALEYKGEYEAARSALADFWPELDQHPDLSHLAPGAAGELLLRAGVLTGAIGSRTQVADAHERAKDLISECLTIFESQNNKDKVYEAHTELALCYWRTGEINEARDLLEGALLHFDSDSEAKAKAVIRLAVVEHTAGCDDKALQILTSYADLFDRIPNHTLKGSYHSTLANRLENLGKSQTRGDYIDRALIEYAAASYHFEQAEHRIYLADVENNLGFLYFKINRCDEAHEHLDHARQVFVSLKDSGAIAQVDETRACVFLKQGRVMEAERAAHSSVSSFEESGKHALLAEALITHGRALARLGSRTASLSAFRRAIELAQLVGNENRAREAALAVFDEIGDHLRVAEGEKLTSGRGLSEDVRAFEHDVIKRALESANGSVTNAARRLGMSYQGLTYMLETRHKDLLQQRTPVRRRPRKSYMDWKRH
jgi:tetratricopeptide (TPR) repeat protein